CGADMKNDSANQSRKRMLLALGAVIPLVVVAGCSSATTEEAVADRGTIENSGAGSGANEGSTEPGSITLSNATRKAGIRDVRILIYQRDVTGQTETATAWRIDSVLMSDRKVVEIAPDLTIRNVDSYGNSTEPVPAAMGTKWSVQLDRSGVVLVPAGQAAADSIHVQNNLLRQTTTVDLLRGGKVLASSSLPPKPAGPYLTIADQPN
ncbi:MAG: hypothetical protein KAZ48_10340, partial [Candidatus Nanopelagicales bacterium]|nr:hypothetical protein [Candidatus Nanopelagicales bacterium]